MSSIESILIDLQQKIVTSKMRADSNITFCKNREAYCWIHATDDYSGLLPRESYGKNPPKLFMESAMDHYDKWFRIATDLKFRMNIIPQPNQEDRLIDYLAKLSSDSLSKDKQSKWWESLTSFINFTRLALDFDDRAYLNNIFPDKMRIHHESIIRIVPKTLYPVDIFVASEIIQALVNKVLAGRKNVQRSAAEALGFAWLCLAFSWLYLPTYEENLHQISTEDLFKGYSGEEPYSAHVNVLTLFGDVKVPVSEHLYAYLEALSLTHDSDSKLIFKLPLRSIKRSFDSTSCLLPTLSNLGKITFLTLTYPPHEVIGRRYRG